MGKIIVVDCGRTNMRAYLLSLEGETLARVLGTGMDHSDPQTTAQMLRGLVSSLVEQTGGALSEILVAVGGLAGYGREKDCRELEMALKENGSSFPWLVESDAHQTLRAAREEGPVAVGLLGTGSAFFARDVSGAIHRTGGHGAIFEDYGSAYEISRQAVMAMMRCYDGMGPDSPVFATLVESTGCGDPFELRSKLARSGSLPSELAKLAPLVLQHAEAGDAVSMRILGRQLEKVVDCLWALIHKAILPIGTPVFFSGGMVEKSPYYLEGVEMAVTKGLPDNPCGLIEHEPYWGGWLLAHRWLEGKSRDSDKKSSTG
jgi:N-acetylglucosamine kinase-like BadF-type ATPase